MKRFLSILLFATAVASIAPHVAHAADRTADSGVVSSEEVSGEVDDINADASTAAGEAAVIDRIKGEFGVSDAVIKDLRAQKLGYGEITLALSLAERLPGGINGENLDKVMELRQGPPVQGWGNVARSLDLSLKPSKEKLEKVGKETSKGADSKKEGVRLEKTEKVEKAEKPQKPERVEKMERVERPERPEKGGRR